MSRLLFVIGFCSLILSACGRNNKADDEHILSTYDWENIVKSDTITAVTLYSSTSYFQYKMQSMGYEYDMISDFARRNNLNLNLKVAVNVGQMIEMLRQGEADLIAFPIAYSTHLKQNFIFCGKEEETFQVLVQRDNKGDTILKDVTQLIGKEIQVKNKTKYATRLKNLNEELGGGIVCHENDNDSITQEDLIEMVSKGNIPYTISDNKTAQLNKTYFWNLNVNLKVSFMQRSSWLVRKESPVLAEKINLWAANYQKNPTYKAVMKRYFELSKQPISAELSEVKDGHISPYDEIFKHYAPKIGWDWQLLASISYQESRFNPNVVSWAGAEGLMGIMPNTARMLGVTPHELKDPNIGVRTAINCLHRFKQGFRSIENPLEQIKFTLAAYNAGIGHIYDAQKLAKKYGKNEKLWNDVVEYVRLKSDPKYYNDPVCKHGYLRGSETTAYVHDVIQRYTYYKNKTQ